MTLAYRCAIAPLDQSTTRLGWQPGFYQRNPCGISDCRWWDQTLQFLADPGTPIVAPVPVTVLSTSPFLVRPTIPWTDTFGRVSHWGDPSSLDVVKSLRIRGIVPAVAAGAQVEKGALLGRVSARERGIKMSLWDPAPTLLAPHGSDASGIVALFHDLGLDVVDAGPQDVARFDRTPMFGGHLLARAGGPADCTVGGAVHGLLGGGALERYFSSVGLATGIAPSGYVEPDGSVYARYGTSKQTDTRPPVPSHENVSPAAAGAGAGPGLLILGALGAWWYSRR